MSSLISVCLVPAFAQPVHSTVNVPAAGGTYSFDYPAYLDLIWPVTPGFVHMTSIIAGTQTGSLIATYRVDANGGIPRTATINFPGDTNDPSRLANTPPNVLTIDQLGTTFIPTSAHMPAVGGTGNFNVTTDPALSWNAVAADSWLSLTSGASATGSNTVNFSVPANNTGSTRASNIAVGTLKFNVTQDAFAYPPVNLSASSVMFSAVLGGPPPPAQTLAISSASPNGSYAITLASGAPWLSVSSTSGTLPGTTAVTADPAGLAVGTYNASAVINNATIPVTLTVANPTVTLSSNSLFFERVQPNQPIASQSVVVSANGGPLQYSASAQSLGNWLSVSNAAAALPNAFSVSVNSQALTGGEYSGTITVHIAGVLSEALTIPVTLRLPSLYLTNLSTSPNVSADLVNGHVNFSTSVQSTQGAMTVNIGVNSITGDALDFTDAGAVSTGPSWLSFSPASGTTPGQVTLTADPTGISSGVYSGYVTFTSLGLHGHLSSVSTGRNAVAEEPFDASTSQSAPGDTITLGVTLSVDANNEISVDPPAIGIQYASGAGAPSDVTLRVSSDSPLPFYVATSGGNWLSAPSSGGTTPGSVTIHTDATGFHDGVYNGSISITAPGAANSPVLVPITINIQAKNPPFASNYEWINLVGYNKSKDPAVSVLNIATPNAGLYLPFYTSAPVLDTWLSISPGYADPPAKIMIAADTYTLNPGAYNSLVAFAGGNSNMALPVWLTVKAQPSLIEIGGPISFQAVTGGPDPAPQNLYLASTSRPVTYSVATSGEPWLQVSAVSKTTPSNIHVSTAPGAGQLAPGNYYATITISAPDTSTGALTIPATLSVGTQAPAVAIANVVGLGSKQAGPLAPGLLVALTGLNLPLQQTPPAIIEHGAAVPTQLSGVRVLFNGTPGPILQVSSTEVHAMTPYEMAGQSNVSVQLEYLGQASAALSMNVVAARPEILMVNEVNGAFARHTDGTAVSRVSPAAADSVISLFASGLGSTYPALPSTSATSGSATVEFASPLHVTIAGEAADILWSGPVPGRVPGIIQLNVRVPHLNPGLASVVLSAGAANSSGKFVLPVH